MFDTINSMGNYSKRVRRLGEFHPELAKIMTPDGQDIDDPLYGNKGGVTEKVSTSFPIMLFACWIGRQHSTNHTLGTAQLRILLRSM